MSRTIILNDAGCHLSVAPNGEVRFSFDDTSLTLAASHGESGDVRIMESDSSIKTTSRRGVFDVAHRFSMSRWADRCVLRVDCTAAGRRGGPIGGLVDRWTSSIDAPYDLRWAPNLRPDDDMRIGSHCFRSPALIISGRGGWTALVPDLEAESSPEDIHLCALDLDGARSNHMVLGYGIEPTVPTGHVYFRRDPEAAAVEGRVLRFSYYLILGRSEGRREALRVANDFLWNCFAGRYLRTPLPQTVPYERYADYAYRSLVSTPPFVRLDVGGQTAGGISAEAAHAEYFKRPHPVIWNQYWFNNQRAAYGFGVFGRARNASRRLDAGRLMTSATMNAPGWGGLWPAIYAYEKKEWWGSIPRLNGGRRRIHVADAAQTGEWLLRWQQDVESTGGELTRVLSLAHSLCGLQEPDGSIPPWFDWVEGELRPDSVLRRSAETGAATVFLGEVARYLEDSDARNGLLRGAEFLASEVMPRQMYQDFETFFSCSPKSLDMVDPHTGIHPQNSLAVFWTARTMLHAHRLTGADDWLQHAVEATDSLSLYQQVWNPPYLNLYAFGGFGVMNTDAEWNDARQSLFAPHYFDMFEVTGLEEYLQRGRAALRASFALASIPENAHVSPNTFDSYPAGLMPENYGHAGRDVPAGRSDACWGEAGALSSVALILRRYPDLIDDLTSS